MRKIVVFGCGKIGYAVRHYIEQWGLYDVVAHVVDAAFVIGPFAGKPVIAADELVERFPPSDYAAFVALGYQQLNRFRAEKKSFLTDLGYELVNVINPMAPNDLKVGSNCFVAAGETIQPAVAIGDNAFVWNGALIGHNAVVEEHAWVTGGAAIGGNATIGAFSFVGIGATIGHNVTVGEAAVIGAGALCTKDVADKSVLIAQDTPTYRLNSNQFVKLSGMFRE